MEVTGLGGDGVVALCQAVAKIITTPHAAS